MSRKRSRPGRHQADIHQAICSVEPLETRTLLSVATVNAGTTVNAVPTNLLGVNAAPWDFASVSTSTLTLSQAAGLDNVRLGGGSYVDANWHFNVSSSNYEPIGAQANYIANLGATAIIDVNYGTASPEEAVAEWAYLNGNPNDTTSIASLFGNNPGDAEQWNTSTSSWTQGVNWQSIGYWASLRAANPISGNPDGLNFLRLDETAFNFTTWEMGNEIYGGWETDEHGLGGDALPMPAGDTVSAHNPTTLISFSKQFQTAINSVLADGFESAANPISIGIDAQNPNTAGTNAFGSGTDGNWINDILSQSAIQGFTLGYIADHYYTNDSGSHASDSGLLAVSNSAAGASISGLSSYTNTSNPYNWQARAADYDNDFNTFLPGQNITLIADEVNSISSSPGEQSTSLVNGLFIADALGSILNTTGADGLGGYQGFDIWDLHNGPFTTNFTSRNLYGWRMGGDYGILGNASGAAAPIDGSNEPYPDYFAIQLASKIIQNGGTVVSASEDNETSVDTYAVMESNGDLELLVINKTKPTTAPPNNLPDQTLTEQFNITGYNANDTATLWQYGPAQDDAQDNATNDATSLMNSSISLGISGGTFSFALPDYSMSVFILTPSGTAPLTVTQAAAANPSPVTGTTTTLSALGSENGSGAGLNYTWTATSVPLGVAAPTYSLNGTNAAASTLATFFGAGAYTFQVTISDASSNSVTSSVNVTVNLTLTSIALSPSNATINENASQSFTASGKDQFGVALTNQPTFTWSVISGIGSVNASGRYSSPAASGVATVQAASGAVTGTASVTINNATPTVAQAAQANPNPVTGTSTALTVLGADDGGESNLTYTWGAVANVSYTGATNGTNAAKNITANFAQPGDYNLTVTITDSGGLSVTSSVEVIVPTVPAVSAFVVNDGNAQRSMVDSLTVTFNEPVLLAAGAITLNLLSQTGGPSTPITNFDLNSPDGGTTWLMTFTDPSYIGGSLPDGAYEVSVSAAGVTGQGLNMSADQNFTFYRIYGDFQGTGAVTGADFTQLVGLIGKPTNSSDWYVDFDGDGVISGSDFTAFVTRLGHSMSVPNLPSVVLLAAAPPVTTAAPPVTTAAPPVTTAAATVTTTSTPKKPSVFSDTPIVVSAPKPASKPKPRHGHH
jgi:hypothetical protein